MTTTTSRAALSPLEELAYAHRPSQLTVLADLVQTLSGVQAVTQLLVRGSLAAGTADRLSDVDLVVAVTDERLLALMGSLDAVMSTEFGALRRCWCRRWSCTRCSASASCAARSTSPTGSCTTCTRRAGT